MTFSFVYLVGMLYSPGVTSHQVIIAFQQGKQNHEVIIMFYKDRY